MQGDADDFDAEDIPAKNSIENLRFGAQAGASAPADNSPTGRNAGSQDREESFDDAR